MAHGINKCRTKRVVTVITIQYPVHKSNQFKALKLNNQRAKSVYKGTYMEMA